MIYNTIRDVIIISWPTLVIILSIMLILRVGYIIKSERKFVLHEELFNFLFNAYILILFQLVTSQDINGGGTNLIPFKEILRYEVGSALFYKQIIGNVILFIPLGYFASNYCKVKKISGVMLITFLCSSIIECVQHFIGRSFDIDDIILNVVGGILGFLVLVAFRAIDKHLPEFLRKDWFKNILMIIIYILIGFGIYSVL